MESNKPLRTHPKMTKVLLGQIDSLDKAGHSVEDSYAEYYSGSCSAWHR